MAAALIEHFEAHRGDLSEDSLTRLTVNPMRILDSKDPRDRPIADSAPDIDAFLTDEARDFFGSVTGGLDAAGVAWTRDARLVRGLDYYRHTAFEFVTDRLGAQGTVLGGGRYDGLIETLGGPHTPAVGWAAGIERLGMMLGEVEREETVIAVIPESVEFQMDATLVAKHARDRGLAVLTYYKGTAKKQSEKAKQAGVDGILYIKRDLSGCPQPHLTSNGDFDSRGDLMAKVQKYLPDDWGGDALIAVSLR